MAKHHVLSKDELDKVRLIEGFPHGKDKDIIALSDPPFFTACINPWLDKVGEDSINAPNKSLSGEYVSRHPITVDISEGKNDPIYNAHSYHTKVPHRAIMRYILHYTKTIVAAFGDEEGWDRPVGLKTEIIPLTRPFGLYAGNVFQGVVMMDGKPVPHSLVEVEYYNKDKKAQAPSDYMVTQVLRADANGVFTWAVPRAGWWGFAALNPSDKKIPYKGVDKDVELGAVLWVEFLQWKEVP